MLAHIVATKQANVSVALSSIRERMLADMKAGNKVEIEYKLSWEELLAL